MGKGVSHFVLVSIGTGVGMGVMIDGGLYRGARGAAGEISHLTDGRAGRRGRPRHCPWPRPRARRVRVGRVRRRHRRGGGAPRHDGGLSTARDLVFERAVASGPA
ncbi:ROK family protein [Microbispora hainanensis]|uniref:ROK family protein n=1 Tax=Microbispora hainanensis TaxID=568844 RepID=UPI0033E25802